MGGFSPGMGPRSPPKSSALYALLDRGRFAPADPSLGRPQSAPNLHVLVRQAQVAKALPPPIEGELWAAAASASPTLGASRVLHNPNSILHRDRVATPSESYGDAALEA